MIIDDVITAGTTVKEAVEILNGAGSSMSGITVAMDREERGAGEISAIHEIEKNYPIEGVSVLRVAGILQSGRALVRTRV